MIKLQDIAPAEIEAESFRIIEAEFSAQTGREIDEYSEGEFRVLQRVIHATGDFAIADHLVFHNNPIEAAIAALRDGRDVITDVNMVASGISKTLLARYGGVVRCRIAEEETAELARAKQITRSEAAMIRSCTDGVGLVAIGNAPTALVSVLGLIEQKKMSPGVIVGVPVGFVNAAESKELLKCSAVPAITITGRRGGSPIAAAIVNALLRLA